MVDEPAGSQHPLLHAPRLPGGPGAGQHACPDAPHGVHAVPTHEEAPFEHIWPARTHVPASQQPSSHGAPDVQHASPATPQVPTEKDTHPGLGQFDAMAAPVAGKSVVPSAPQWICVDSQFTNVW